MAIVDRILPISHDEELPVVDHLSELRKRGVWSVVIFLACFGLCIWQNGRLLDFVNKPLSGATSSSKVKKNSNTAVSQRLNEALASLGQAAQSDLKDRPQLAAAIARVSQEAKTASRTTVDRKPVTLGVGEPLTATLTVALYGALFLSLPFLLYQVFAFINPAFSWRERKVALPAMLIAPLLFAAGVAFTYLFVLPQGLNFVQNFNSDRFQIMLQAKDYYQFTVVAMSVMGLLFQLPLMIAAASQLELVTAKQLRSVRRYAVVVIAIVAMMMPGSDPLTMLLMMLPLLVLYEGSILFAAFLERRRARLGSATTHK